MALKLFRQVLSVRSRAPMHVIAFRCAPFSSTAPEQVTQSEPEEKISMPAVTVFKREITQSPKKVRFLLKLVGVVFVILISHW